MGFWLRFSFHFRFPWILGFSCVFLYASTYFAAFQSLVCVSVLCCSCLGVSTCFRMLLWFFWSFSVSSQVCVWFRARVSGFCTFLMFLRVCVPASCCVLAIVASVALLFRLRAYRKMCNRVALFFVFVGPVLGADLGSRKWTLFRPPLNKMCSGGRNRVHIMGPKSGSQNCLKLRSDFENC